jgi:hypothetical protein
MVDTVALSVQTAGQPVFTLCCCMVSSMIKSPVYTVTLMVQAALDTVALAIQVTIDVFPIALTVCYGQRAAH